MIFCQRCKQANPEEFEYCESCGTRLMLVTNERDGEFYTSREHAFEEYLLERISLLETTLIRANDRFEQVLELVQHQAQGNLLDHIMLETLTEVLGENKTIEPLALELRWRRRLVRHYEDNLARELLDERCDQIISAFRGKQRDQREKFIDLIEEAIALIGEGRTRRGLRLLESASALDEQNAELCFTIAQYQIQVGKAVEAATYLERALASQQNLYGAQLLLGLLESESGQPETAREHLEKAIELNEKSFAAHYGLGRLLAREGNLSDALSYLKRALSLKPVPEMHYLVGRMYWEKGRVEQALRHLKKAVRLDPKFDAALYSLGWMYWQMKRTPEAREHLLAAYELNPQDTHYRAAVDIKGGEELPVPPALGWETLFPASPPRLGQKHSEKTNHNRKANIQTGRFAALLSEDLEHLRLTPERGSFRRSA
jgi:tetratricopeptide (TPR) repeat protein